MSSKVMWRPLFRMQERVFSAAALLLVAAAMLAGELGTVAGARHEKGGPAAAARSV